MGICYGTPVDDGPSKPTSPAACEEKRKRENNYNKPNGLERKASGDKLKEEKKHPVVAAKGQGDNKVSENIPSSGKIVTPNLKVFTLAELRAATKNFRPDTKLGEGGFGQVFKGWVDKTTYAPSRTGVGMAVAVKKSNPDSLQGLQEWQAEVKFLGKFSHPNLVKLLGYCWEEGQYLLVYEYMQKGSLESHLFRKGAEPLPWDIRLKIAIDAAKGLTFLHCSEKSVIYRDFKASNILLDGDYNAKLSDFGLAKLGPIDGNSHLTTSVMGTYGYAAPEYVATGHLYVKSDVYGFGVVLLEMLTGLRALDTNRPFGQHNLVDYAKPSLSNKRKLKKLMDPRLEGQYPFNAASKAAELILTCLESDPKNRPSMEEVLETLETISAVEKETPTNKVKHKAATNHHFKKRPEQSCSNQHNKRSYDHHHHRVPPRSTHDDCGISARPYNY